MKLKIDHDYLNQLRTISTIYLGFILFFLSLGYLFWNVSCPEGTSVCLQDSSSKLGWFLFYSVIRPILFTPALIMPWIAGSSFGIFSAVVLSIVSILISCMILYLPTKYIGKKFVFPWMRANFPALLELIINQDYKIIFISRWIPILPFDILSLLFGFCNFKFKSVLYGTILGSSPGIVVFCLLSLKSISIFKAYEYLLLFSVIGIIPFLIYECLYIPRKTNKKTFISLLKSFYKELMFELKIQHNVSPLQVSTIKNININSSNQQSNQSKPTLLLMYGFLSSRKSLITLERQFYMKGFNVVSFNMGGLLNTFFTKSISEAAEYLDTLIKGYFKQYNVSKISIVAHSKGGLVSMWWLLKLGGYKYCDTIVTMGTPYKGSPFSYIGLLTPFGFFWKDIWQMRPKSEFLKSLHSCEIPSNLNIYCLNSNSDIYVKGNRAVYSRKEYSSQIHPISMNGISHFEFMYRKEVVSTVNKILKDKLNTDINKDNNTSLKKSI